MSTKNDLSESADKNPSRRMWSRKVLTRYTLFQIPALVILVLLLWVVRRWLNIPLWISACVLVVWIIKDVVLFPITWKAYDTDSKGKTHTMIGKKGKVKNRLDPAGYVVVNGELWKAEAAGEGAVIEEGEDVRIVNIDGLTLYVEKNS